MIFFSVYTVSARAAELACKNKNILTLFDEEHDSYGEFFYYSDVDPEFVPRGRKGALTEIEIGRKLCCFFFYI